jgi:tRNA G18 (ribose-2'-O)-methylase SpoU
MSVAPTIPIESADDPRIAEFRDIRERDLTGRQGRFIAEGTVVLRMLAEAHAADRGFVAEKILLLRNRVDGIQDILARFPAEVPVYVADADVLDGIVGFNMHRGVLALGRRQERGEGALLDALPENAMVLVGAGISNHDNAGSIFRNAAAFKTDAIFFDETCCDPLYRKALRVSVGSVLSVPYHRGGDVLTLLAALAERGFAIWTLSPRGETDIRQIPPSQRMALVVGTEGEGLPDAVLKRFHSARIPQSEGLDSLNVATTTGIALFAMASAAGRV